METERRIRALTDESLQSFNQVLNSKRCAGITGVACLECPLHISGVCLRHMVANEIQRRQILADCSLSELIAEIRRRPNITEVKTNGS